MRTHMCIYVRGAVANIRRRTHPLAVFVRASRFLVCAAKVAEWHNGDSLAGTLAAGLITRPKWWQQ